MFVAAIVGWVIALVAGRLPDGLHRFFCAYIRYSTHLYSYVALVANPYPGFVGEASSYPVDVGLPGGSGPESSAHARSGSCSPYRRYSSPSPLQAEADSRAGTGTGKPPPRSSAGSRQRSAVLGWFASLFSGRMPSGLRDAGAYAFGYRAQVLAYVLLVTERYPNADPHALLATLEPPPVHPVHVVGDSEDLRRSRVTVFFRLPLVIPLLVWLALWSVLAGLAVDSSVVRAARPWTAGDVVPSFRLGVDPLRLPRLRIRSLAANPFPGFTGRSAATRSTCRCRRRAGRAGGRRCSGPCSSFPHGSSRRHWRLPRSSSAFLIWFYAIVTGRAPEGLRNALAYAIRYSAQVTSYLYLLTDAYPHSSPLEGAEPLPVADGIAAAQPLPA